MSNPKNILVWLGVFVFIILLFNLSQGDNFSSSKSEIAFSDFISRVDSGEVSSIKISGRTIEGQLTNGSNFTTNAIEYPNLLEKLYNSGASIEVISPDTKMNSIFSIFVSWFPMLLFIGIWIFFMRQMGGGAGKAMGFGKSKAKLLSDKGKKVTFKDVAGIDEAKDELSEVVDFLRDPGKFHRLGGKIPKGCLLVGPPGTGKTMLAKAIAGEANVPFFSISGSDFVEMFVGVGASRVRDMFEQGKKNAPCIIFIDEIDAVGRHRGIGIGGGNDEREQTLNQLLVEMDGFEANEGVIIIAATNRPDVLDPALLRPGRFDRQISISYPDINGREKILKVHAAKMKVNEQKVDIRRIARGTPGFSGAQLANLCNEAALLAARKGKRLVEMIDMEEAKDKVMMGPEKRSMVMSEEQIKLTAYHEAGHALSTIYSNGSHPIYKATIIPRGRSLGMVMSVPEKDQVSHTREFLLSNLVISMGGRAAEEIIFGYDKVTTGAMGDIESATNTARHMVTEAGLSDAIGPILHKLSSGNYQGNSSEKSEKTLELIDSEIKRLVDQAYEKSKKILNKHIDELHLLANALIEHETLTGEQIQNIIKGKDIDHKDVKKDTDEKLIKDKTSKKKTTVDSKKD